MRYLPSDASRETARQGLPLSSDTIRLAVKKGELKASITSRGVRIIEQDDLDAFIQARKAKKLTKPSEPKQAA